MSNSDQAKTKYCKKCGCELVSTNKHKICEDCRRKRNGKVRNSILTVGGTVGGFVLLAVTKGNHGSNGKNI